MELRRMFSEATMSAKSLAESSYSSMKDLDISTFNEDGELLLAFEAQKRTLRYILLKISEQSCIKGGEVCHFQIVEKKNFFFSYIFNLN